MDGTGTAQDGLGDWPDGAIRPVPIPDAPGDSGVAVPKSDRGVQEINTIPRGAFLPDPPELTLWDKIRLLLLFKHLYSQFKDGTMKDWKTTLFGAIGGVLVAVGDMLTAGGTITLKGLLSGAALALLGWFSGDKKTGGA